MNQSPQTPSDKEVAANIQLEKGDERPLISDLLEEHTSAIKAVCDQIQDDPLYDKSRYDDIWILRFILSHKKSIKDASQAAQKTMQFRHDKKLNELGDIRHTIPNNLNKCEGEHFFHFHRKYFQYCKSNDAIMHTLPNKDRGNVTYITPSKVDLKTIADELSDEDLLNVHLYTNEAIYQILDEVTRRTGRLTKFLKVTDLSGISFDKISRKYIKKDTAAVKIIEDHYPQLLGAVLLVNPPSWIGKIFKIFRPLLPRRVQQKINVVSPKDVKPFLRFVSEENLPEKYGGKNNVWPPACAGTAFE
mmetsp:Transcript_1573/g.2249  ORF Transcript_1573/g.2249 Transcript_1573/m.2249 type:complete len:303 (-) Transcript_1573:189-1097(-)|eukprot:CAMPEP_0185724806 /NCGR_PEP_ID=MMETSP1171-20130828/1183_1 /TAXON_ID=374046 /ORGANISM="Helicotheca tamensis, Strain CCMP826" /LENGTH=302 /DNA_ID=CAMNT_0028392739 /DNA_START=121 /DNA_END=1029 /DNA_ORIENTATION=-